VTVLSRLTVLAPATAPERALFVIDAEGTVQWSHVSPPPVNPGADSILAALESISADAPTPYGVIA